AAVIGTISTFGGALIGALIDVSYDGTILPLSIGLAVGASAAFAFFKWSDMVWDAAISEDAEAPVA
ncbi:MAG: hypothetical protein ACR2N9_03380, partial [Acidimicrobiia bacterium]